MTRGWWRLVCLLPLAGAAAAPAAGLSEQFERDGLAVEATVSPIGRVGADQGLLRAGEAVTVRFRVSDRAGKPLTGAFPSGWMVARDAGGMGAGDAADADGRCRLALRRLLTSRLQNQAEVDLNGFAVLALNEDGTISVIDPLGGFAGTRLIGLVRLSGVGEDWAQLPDQDRLAVTVPDADAVDIVDTRSWNASVRRLDVGAKPRRVALQPDRSFFWADATDPATGAAMVVAVNADTLAVAGRVPVGRGPHDFAFTADSRFLFVANAGAGTVSIVDVAAVALAAELATGSRPVSLAYSDLANAVYVADAEDGRVTVLDARSHAVRARIAGPPGIAQIRFAPGGRFAFVANRRAGTVTVIDASLDRAIQTVDTPLAPDQVTFTSTMAYVRQGAGATVSMFPLDKVTADGGALPVFEFSGGNAPAAAAERPSAAPAIVPVGGDRAVLVANAGDREIYYYQEGFAAPMGSFSNYRRQPRAVTVVRRDLREREAGVYETNAQLGRPGAYALVFRLDQPSFYHCFSFDVTPVDASQARQAARIAPAAPVGAVPAGGSVDLEFVVTDATTGGPVTDLTDLTVLVMTPSWQERRVAKPLGDGRYNVNFLLPAPGFYAVMVRSATAGIAYQPMPGLTVTAAQ